MGRLPRIAEISSANDIVLDSEDVRPVVRERAASAVVTLDAWICCQDGSWSWAAGDHDMTGVATSSYGGCLAACADLLSSDLFGSNVRFRLHFEGSFSLVQNFERRAWNQWSWSGWMTSRGTPVKYQDLWRVVGKNQHRFSVVV